MRVFIILATVSLIVIFSVLKYFDYRKENSEDCEGEWSWTECDKKCSTGDSVRYGTFRTTKEVKYDGKCQYKTGDEITEACPASECPPEDCEGEEIWEETCVGYCSDNDAYLLGKYVVTSEEKYLGEKCPFEDEQILIKECPVDMCPPEDCKISVDWEECDSPCSTGESKRKGVVSVATNDYYSGSCDYQNGQVITESCPESACPPEDCEGVWVEDTACQGVCSSTEGAKLKRTYNITKAAEYGGELCPHKNNDTDYIDCPVSKCPSEDCEGVWVEDTVCQGVCSEGAKLKRTYEITKAAKYGGNSCSNNTGDTDSIDCPGADNKLTAKCPAEDCKGEFQSLVVPECDTAEEGVACVRDGVYYDDKTDDIGKTLPDGFEFVSYKILSPANYGGKDCMYESGKVEMRRKVEQV